MKFKGSDTLPRKKAIFESYINQQLSVATGFVATGLCLRLHTFLAGHFLCISDVCMHQNAEKNGMRKLLGDHKPLLARVAVHCVDQGADMLGRCVLADAMTQVEDVRWAAV